MNRFKTAFCAAFVALLALGAISACTGNKPATDTPEGIRKTKEGSKSAIEMLEDARKKMHELATCDLSCMDTGKQTQDKEQVVIQTLEDIIQMILDEQTEQGRDNESTSLPPLAEVRLLKFLEETIKSDTIEINNEFSDLNDSDAHKYRTNTKKHLCERLAIKQAENAELARNIIEDLKKKQ